MQRLLDASDLFYAVTLCRVGLQDPTRQEACFAKADPLLQKGLEQDPKNTSLLVSMRDMAQARKDTAQEQKYQAALDVIHPPDPKAVAYNAGVDAYNAKDMATAKQKFEQVLVLDPKYQGGEVWYMLALSELGLKNEAGMKVALAKYLEVAPEGKRAAKARKLIQ
jgi:tetratricopeptide (TPR) repeat protein